MKKKGKTTQGFTQEDRIRARIEYDSRPESEKIFNIPEVEVLKEPTKQTYYGLFWKRRMKIGEHPSWWIVNNQFYQNENKARTKMLEYQEMDDVARVMLIKFKLEI